MQPFCIIIIAHPSDYDKSNKGVVEPNIDMKVEVFIAKYKKCVSESALYQLVPSAENSEII